uniref:Ferredoxin n=1 Tax=Pleonosporium borreri TaxID=2575635 RepID=A0A4D6WW93_9FLOR|nr:ferredoxin [Pleonosporium borreri]
MVVAYKVNLIISPKNQKSLNLVINCPENQYILEAAEAQGIELPVSCRAGSCSVCIGIVQEGTVFQENINSLDLNFIEQNFILTCITYPKSNCTIITHQEDKFYNL